MQQLMQHQSPIHRHAPALFTGSSSSSLHRLLLGRRTSGRFAANGCTCGNDAGGSGRRSPSSHATGQKRKESCSPDVCLKLLAHACYCALHSCADAQGRATNCAAGPPAAAAAASTAPAAPIESSFGRGLIAVDWKRA